MFVWLYVWIIACRYVVPSRCVRGCGALETLREACRGGWWNTDRDTATTHIGGTARMTCSVCRWTLPRSTPFTMCPWLCRVRVCVLLRVRGCSVHCLRLRSVGKSPPPLPSLRERQCALPRTSLCTALYCTVQYCTVLYCTVLYCTVCNVMQCNSMHYTVLYCNVL